MEVAVGINRLDLLTLAQGEAGLRLITGLEQLALGAVRGLDGDPLDVVRLRHGMRHGADRYEHLVVLDLIDGNMLFMGGVRRAGHDLLHLLAAAHQRRTGLLHDGNDLSAMDATVKLQFHAVSPCQQISGRSFRPVFDYIMGMAELARVECLVTGFATVANHNLSCYNIKY